MSTSKTEPPVAVHATCRKEWRAWLRKNHARESAVWLSYFKKATGKPSVTYSESVEEALCFGWIDGIKRSFNDDEYGHRFTPRRVGSKWSPLNIRRAKKMIDLGQMTRAGQTKFDQRKTYETKPTATSTVDIYSITAETEKALRSNKKAWANFNKLAPGYQKRYIGWIQSAKKEETIARRLKDSIDSLEKGEKPGMK